MILRLIRGYFHIVAFRRRDHDYFDDIILYDIMNINIKEYKSRYQLIKKNI